MPHVSYYVDAPGQWESGHTLPDLVLTHHSYVCCEVGSYNSQLLRTEQSCIGKSTRRASRATEVPECHTTRKQEHTKADSIVLAHLRPHWQEFQPISTGRVAFTQ